MSAILISKVLRMARINEGSHSFTCHAHVYPRMEWAILPLLPAVDHHTLAQYSFPRPADGRRLSWIGWLHGYVARRSPIQY